VPWVAGVDRHRRHPPGHRRPAPRPGPGCAPMGDGERPQRPPGRPGVGRAGGLFEGGQAGSGVGRPVLGRKAATQPEPVGAVAVPRPGSRANRQVHRATSGHRAHDGPARRGSLS
jgi:hypothetical protein